MRPDALPAEGVGAPAPPAAGWFLVHDGGALLGPLAPLRAEGSHRALGGQARRSCRPVSHVGSTATSTEPGARRQV